MNVEQSAEVGLAELHRNTSDIVRRVEAGEELIVTVSGRPAIRLVSAATKKIWLSSGEFSEVFAGLPPWGERDDVSDLIDDDFKDPWHDTAHRQSANNT